MLVLEETFEGAHGSVLAGVESISRTAPFPAGALEVFHGGVGRGEL